MKSVFSILLVGVALFGGAFAASVPPAKIGKKCSPADGRAITECKAHIQEYMKGVEDLTEEDIKQRINIHGFKEKCAPVNQCLTSLSHCDIYGNGQMTLLTNVVRTFCNLVTYLAESPCSQKMHAHDSKCFKEWNPYLEKDDVKDENRRKEAYHNAEEYIEYEKSQMRDCYGNYKNYKELLETTDTEDRDKLELIYRSCWNIRHYSGLGNGTVAWKDCERLEVIKDLLKNLIDWKDQHEDDDAVLPDDEEEPKP
ncbi:Protein CBG00778 [Caenorhabditis briggsae]|uniref:Protein CBG00778 n=1 Tax=Caenorhabditis briggsae TaxID=6238 RepID=A8WNT3_CAEBR|nr:Protein CBG00778 [Caenorhabditis briggsae]CAP22139.1 Protein CBG00778 [Caenorhabditis briggsae]